MENSIPPQPVGHTQHIWCSVGISKKMEDVLVGFILNQAQNKAGISEYIIYLSTTGGNPFAAIELYNFIKSIPQKTTVYNMGNVYSAGIPFFLGFQTKIGVPDCSFMIHQTTISKSVFPDQINVFDFDRQKATLSAADEKTHKIILKETSGKASKKFTSKSLMDAITATAIYHADEAKKYGFIDKIETPKLPESGVLYITDQYLATLPGDLN